jgi:asparaginyl-tRNA synthetase
MTRTKIVNLLQSEVPVEKVLIKGWIRTVRQSKTFSFIEINDGSCLANLQIIADQSIQNYTDIEKLTTGSALEVTGKLIASQGKGQTWEVQADNVHVISISPPSYP